MRLLEPTAGRVTFEGRDITHLGRREMRPIRREMMMVFQDPYASLNARKRVGFTVGEALEVHRMGTPAEIKRRVQELLEIVGLSPEHYNRFPHEFSGGQRQRIGVARALAVNPRLIVCDEPVSALDVSVSAQILNLLKDLQRDLGLTYVFIAHDLNVVKHISDRVLVMYLGRIVELAARDDLYAEPRHPVHRRPARRGARHGRLASARRASASCSRATSPSPSDPPPGCHFHPRCPRNHAGTCDVEAPVLRAGRHGCEPRRALPLPARALADDRAGDARRCNERHSLTERWSRAVIVAAARRFGLLVVAAAGATALVSLAIGAAVGQLAVALALGRPVRRADVSSRDGGAWRSAYAGDGDGTTRSRDSALFVALGLVLLVLGVLVDTRYPPCRQVSTELPPLPFCDGCPPTAGAARAAGDRAARGLARRDRLRGRRDGGGPADGAAGASAAGEARGHAPPGHRGDEHRARPGLRQRSRVAAHRVRDVRAAPDLRGRAGRGRAAR